MQFLLGGCQTSFVRAIVMSGRLRVGIVRVGNGGLNLKNNIRGDSARRSHKRSARWENVVFSDFRRLTGTPPRFPGQFNSGGQACRRSDHRQKQKDRFGVGEPSPHINKMVIGSPPLKRLNGENLQTTPPVF